jgi:NtrC-family two-component system sensor histidine kinase KinB
MPVERAGYWESILESERWVGLSAKWLLLVLGLICTRFAETYRTFPWLTVGVVAYALMNLAFTLALRPNSEFVKEAGRTAYLISYASDIAFASLVIYYGTDLSNEVYLLYALLALESAIYYPVWPDVVILPIIQGPLYALVLRLSLGSWYFLASSTFWLRYGVLFGVVLATLYLGWLNERSRIREAFLKTSLADRSVELDAKTRATQQMAANLGNRVLELRTLQEGIKAINSALALEDVLRLIVANASQVLEGARCSVTLLTGQHDAAMTMASADWKPDGLESMGRQFDRHAAGLVVHDSKPMLVRDVRQDSRFQVLSDLPIVSIISVPLFLGDEAIGALIATAPDTGGFSDEDVNLLSAFADQAAVAVSNARLYEQLVQEQKQTAQLYQHVEERRRELEAILRGIGDGVIVADPELSLLLMNPVATRMFGVRPDVTSSLPLFDVVPHQELLALFQDALDGEEEAIVREISLAPSQDSGGPAPQDGGEKGVVRIGSEDAAIYQALASPILGADGNVRGVVTVLRDITSQKELERMKSNFLSVVSHELKTPLHSIKGFVDIILMGKTGEINETQADFLGTVRDQTAHLQNLISDLLEFSRLESGQVKLRLTEVSLAEVAHAVIEKLKPLADQGQIEMICHVPTEAPALQADRMRIEQVLTNLVHNAIKFTPAAGTVTVSVTDIGEEIQVAVADTGIGIPASELNRVFDRFYQVDSSSTRHYRGTGLGLTICKHIVEYHHGRIWVESEEGKGSTFTFVLPKRIEVGEDQLLLDFLSLPKKN